MRIRFYLLDALELCAITIALLALYLYVSP